MNEPNITLKEYIREYVLEGRGSFMVENRLAQVKALYDQLVNTPDTSPDYPYQDNPEKDALAEKLYQSLTDIGIDVPWSEEGNMVDNIENVERAAHRAISASSQPEMDDERDGLGSMNWHREMGSQKDAQELYGRGSEPEDKYDYPEDLDDEYGDDYDDDWDDDDGYSKIT